MVGTAPSSPKASGSGLGTSFGVLSAGATALGEATANPKFDIGKSLGLDYEKKSYERRLQALVKPEDYALARGKHWDAMSKNIEAYFNNTVDYLQAAGFDWDEAKIRGKALAKDFADVERQKLELIYPTAANVIGAQGQVNNAFSGAAGQFNPSELTVAANSGGHVDVAKKPRKPRAKK